MNRARGTKAVEPSDFFAVLAPEPAPLKEKVKALFGGRRGKRREVIKVPD